MGWVTHQTSVSFQGLWTPDRMFLKSMSVHITVFMYITGCWYIHLGVYEYGSQRSTLCATPQELHPLFCETGFLTILELGGSAELPRQETSETQLSPVPQHWAEECFTNSSIFTWGLDMELRFSCLHIKAFTNWALSPESHYSASEEGLPPPPTPPARTSLYAFLGKVPEICIPYRFLGAVLMVRSNTQVQGSHKALTNPWAEQLQNVAKDPDTADKQRQASVAGRRDSGLRPRLCALSAKQWAWGFQLSPVRGKCGHLLRRLNEIMQLSLLCKCNLTTWGSEFWININYY